MEFAQLCFVEVLQGFLEGALYLYGAALWAIEARERGSAVHESFELGCSSGRHRNVGRLDGRVSYWDGFEVVLVEWQEAIESKEPVP